MGSVPSAHGNSLRSDHLPACLLFTLLLSLAGCANPGPPRPPSLNLPEPATDLAAERVGDVLELTWTTPARSTDDLPLRGALTAELCEAASAAADAACRPALTQAVIPGASHATLVLPAASLAGPVALLAVRVRLRNAAGRSAGASAPAFTAVGPAPAPIVGFRGSPIEGGASLVWSRLPGADPVLLHRTLLTPSPAKGRHDTAVDTDLAAADAQATDPGGTLDRSAREGETYRYTAQRRRALTLDGYPVVMLSGPSVAVTVRVHDVFPPAPPTGLASVPGMAGAAAPTLELSWDPNPEPDLAGYFVERAELSPGQTPASANPAWVRLTPNLLPAPAFTDTTVLAGQRYRYRVVAADTAGNQSAPSTPVEETAANP